MELGCTIELLFYLRAVQGRFIGTNKNSTTSLGLRATRNERQRVRPVVFGTLRLWFDNRHITWLCLVTARASWCTRMHSRILKGCARVIRVLVKWRGWRCFNILMSAEKLQYVCEWTFLLLFSFLFLSR